MLWPRPEKDGALHAWATLNTADVHALAFAPGDASHLYFGHHNGLLETRDGGRSWQPASLSGVDAMNVQAAGATKIQIAGHEVYVESVDNGTSWQPVPNDLPGLDLHAFAIDPADADHAWTWAVGFGLFETHDGGHHWQLRQPGNWGYLAAYRTAAATALLAVSSEGGVRSLDDGGTWQPLGCLAPSGRRHYGRCRRQCAVRGYHRGSAALNRPGAVVAEDDLRHRGAGCGRGTR